MENKIEKLEKEISILWVVSAFVLIVAISSHL